MEFLSGRSIRGHSDKCKGKMKQKPSQSFDCKEHKLLEPYMLFIMVKYQVSHPYLMQLPLKITRLLPEATFPVVLNCRNRNWMTSYKGVDYKRFDTPTWKIFATDNKLKEGDGCYFELMEWSIKLSSSTYIFSMVI